jgi:hypothetical protein
MGGPIYASTGTDIQKSCGNPIFLQFVKESNPSFVLRKNK